MAAGSWAHMGKTTTNETSVALSFMGDILARADVRNCQSCAETCRKPGFGEAAKPSRRATGGNTIARCDQRGRILGQFRITVGMALADSPRNSPIKKRWPSGAT